MNVALVHERLDILGGAEKVLLALHQLYPEAPLYTSFVDYSHLPDYFRRLDIRPSYMQRLPGFLKRRPHWLLPLDMFAFQDFDLSEYDMVLSSSYVAAKSVLTASETCHICYTHTPMRFAWDLYPNFMRDTANPLTRLGARVLLQYFRMWDVQTSNNVDYFIANSETVRRRIQKHYRRDATVIYPPVQTCRFSLSQAPSDYYLVVSRLVPYKRIDLAVEAFNRSGQELIIIGTGREQKRLEAMARPNIRFLGWQSDEAVARYLSQAKALIFPGEEDFGILPVEAQAAGVPVIAYARGGALETVRHGDTGFLFGEQTPESLLAAIRESGRCRFDREHIAANAARFDERVFAERMAETIRRCYTEFQAQHHTPPPPFLDLPARPQEGVAVAPHAVLRSGAEESPIG